MLDTNVLKNAIKFLERTSVKGTDCYVWCETHSRLVTEVQRAEYGSQNLPAPKAQNEDLS